MKRVILRASHILINLILKQDFTNPFNHVGRHYYNTI